MGEGKLKRQKGYVSKILSPTIFYQNIKAFFSSMFKILKISIVQMILFKYKEKKYFFVHKF